MAYTCQFELDITLNDEEDLSSLQYSDLSQHGFLERETKSLSSLESRTPKRSWIEILEYPLLRWFVIDSSRMDPPSSAVRLKAVNTSRVLETAPSNCETKCPEVPSGDYIMMSRVLSQPLPESPS